MARHWTRRRPSESPSHASPKPFSFAWVPINMVLVCVGSIGLILGFAAWLITPVSRVSVDVATTDVTFGTRQPTLFAAATVDQLTVTTLRRLNLDAGGQTWE